MFSRGVISKGHNREVPRGSPIGAPMCSPRGSVGKVTRRIPRGESLRGHLATGLLGESQERVNRGSH